MNKLKALLPYMLLFIAVVIIIMLCKDCGRNDIKQVDVIKIQDYSDSIVKVVGNLNIARDSIRKLQDVINIKESIIAAKANEKPRIKYLAGKIIRPDIDSLNLIAIDSLTEVALYKEALLDSSIVYSDQLLITIMSERELQDRKDSLNSQLISRLNGAVDSLSEEGKRNKKKAYFKGLKHGLSAGTLIGVTAGIFIAKP